MTRSRSRSPHRDSTVIEPEFWSLPSHEAVTCGIVINAMPQRPKASAAGQTQPCATPVRATVGRQGRGGGGSHGEKKKGYWQQSIRGSVRDQLVQQMMETEFSSQEKDAAPAPRKMPAAKAADQPTAEQSERTTTDKLSMSLDETRTLSDMLSMYSDETRTTSDKLSMSLDELIRSEHRAVSQTGLTPGNQHVRLPPSDRYSGNGKGTASRAGAAGNGPPRRGRMRGPAWGVEAWAEANRRRISERESRADPDDIALAEACHKSLYIDN
jgi:hypothetical protein